MTPETRRSLIVDYLDGEITDGLLCAKYGITDEQLEVAVHIGTGSIMSPEPLTRGLKRGVRGACAVEKLAREYLVPADMAVSPLASAEIIEPAARDGALFLNDAELTFANNVLRGLNAAACAAASFEIFNKQLAERKARELLASPHVREYMESMKGRSLFAPVRNKAYLEAVLNQVIDRGSALRQSYDVLSGKPIEGRCEYNYKAVLGAAALLMKLKGWDRDDNSNQVHETQRDRLRRLQATYGVSRDE